MNRKQQSPPSCLCTNCFHRIVYHVPNRYDLSCRIIPNFTVKFIFEGHDKFDLVETVGSESLHEIGTLGDFWDLVGSGKTHLLRRIEDELARAARVAVAKSLAVDKRRTSLPSLIEALFYDLSPGDCAQVKIPKQAERRERDLRDLMRKGKRPVVLVVDEAHDLHHKTLTGLKRLMEVVADAGVLLSVLLVGHPRLQESRCLRARAATFASAYTYSWNSDAERVAIAKKPPRAPAAAGSRAARRPRGS